MKEENHDTHSLAVDVKNINISCKWKFGFLTLFFLLGLINNLGYVLILTGASQLSKKFDSDNLASLYLFSLIICSSLAKFINSKYLIKISYKIRIFFLSIYFFIGYISLFFILKSVDNDGTMAIGKTEAFLLSLIPSFIMGTGSAFGEATILGYLRNFPKDFVSGWSSGTGLAGVIGALITLVFHTLEIKPKTMYLVISPICIVYCFSFIMVERLFTKYMSSNKQGLLIDQNQPDLVEKLDQNEVLEKNNDVSNNKEFNYKNAILAFKKGSRFILNLATVYFLEYTVLTGFGERVANRGYITSIDKNFQYEYFSLCYQIGVFISRSSLAIVKFIPRVEIFTFIQFINFFVWGTNVYTGFISNASFAFINFAIVGLMGGASYVACFYFLLSDESIESDIKELCVNIASIFNDFGVLLSSITVLILDTTIMK